MTSPTPTPQTPQPQELVSTSEDWDLIGPKDPHPACLLVQQRRFVHAFPYFRLVWVDGDNSRIVIHYVSHEVMITGHGLGFLLSALAANRVARVIEPMASEAKFRKGPTISDILVTKNDEEDEE